jgi:pimeloyl-ACP methyl ester carboxylesterase
MSLDMATTTTAGTVSGTPSQEAWFAGGERVGYDPRAHVIVSGEDAREDVPVRIFLRREGNPAHAVSFMAGFPDGSFGWAKVLPHLPDAAGMPKLFLDYVGMGDSDKPKDYVYSTAERADLVEAMWRHLGVQSTTLVAFDFSSLVVLELLRRRLERSERGEPADGPGIRGVFIFNGGLFTDGHSHPWYTTPMLRRLPEWARRGVGRPFALFKWMPGVRKMWSKGYHVTDAELRELHSAMDRHDGLFYLAAAAGFQADHKAEGERLDFGRLFLGYRNQFPFLVGGSDEDPFEHRQVDLAEERLGKLGLRIERLPGGHLSTNEQPEALAALIAKFERGLAGRPGVHLRSA